MTTDTPPTVPMDDWPQSQDYRVDSDAPTVADEGGGAFRPSHPRQYQTPTEPLESGFPPQYSSPPYSPNQQAPSQQASAGSETVFMDPIVESMPLAWLAVFEGDGGPRGQVHTLRQKETVVGRTTGQWTLGGDSTISSQHFKIRLEEEEGGDEPVFILYDMASTNGTFAGDYESCRQEKHKVYRHVLQDGDFVRVGHTILVFKQVKAQ